MIRQTTLALFMVGLLCSSAAFAEPEGKLSQWREKMEARREAIFQDLNLTEDQKKALKDNKDKHRQETQEVFQAMREKRNLMRQELQKDTIDMAKINQIQSELKVVQAKMLDQRLEGILEVRKILTPEQFRVFNEKMEEHRESKRQHGEAKDGS